MDLVLECDFVLDDVLECDLVLDDVLELNISLKFMKKIVNIIDAEIHSTRIYEGLEGGYIATIRITKDLMNFFAFH